jgi:nucleoid-associated protein YgaU/DNA-binding SARP family transcriptional activator
MSRTGQLLRGLGSLVATLALVVGVPLLLASWVGWPLPSRLPHLDTLEQAAQSGVRDEVLVNTLAVIAWLAWAQIVLALVVEVIALLRGRQPVHLPVIPGLQVTAGRLVAGIVMFASTVHPARAYAEPTPIPAVVVNATSPVAASGAPWTNGVVVDLNSADPVLVSHTIDLTPTAPSPGQATVTVQRHDSYWAIAERTLGDGLRWREILDLNVGRTLPDGTTIRAGDQTLYAGWVLVLPSDAVVEPTTAPVVDATPSAEVPAASETEVVVERGDNLWTISEDRIESELGREAGDPEVAPYWQTVVDANQDRYVQAGNPNLIYPGQVLVLPSTGHAQPAGDPPTEAAPEPADAGGPSETPPPPPTPQTDAPAIDETPTTVTTVPTTASDEAAPSSADTTARADTHADTDAETNDSSLVAVALGALSSIALAVGLKRLLDRRRRRFTNEHPGQLPGRTPPEQHEVHQAIVAQADEERIDDLQGVLGRLSASLAASGSDRRPRMIRHSGDVLEVLLDEPDTHAPAGWNSTDDGTVWTLVDVPDPESPYEGPLSPAPLMVTVGQPEDDAQLYLDLEADGLISLTGDGEVAANLGRSIVTELTLSPLADTIRVIAIGDVVDPDAKVLEHLTIVESWDSHSEDLMAWTSQSHDALGENGWANAFIGRGTDPDHDALVPIAVVADRPPPDDLAAALRSAQPSAVAVVVVGDFPDALATVRCEDDALNFDMVDLACAPQQMDADELAAISSVLVATDSPEEQELMEQLRAEFDASASSNGNGSSNPNAGDAGIPGGADEPPEAEVLVRLLGDIEVDGGQPLKPKATAVVAYLALHRSVTTARLEEACWFGSDGATHTKRIHDTMAEVRSALGSQHFPANRSGRYVVEPQVRTDLELFDWHVQQAAVLPTEAALEHYQAALDMVTGKPFSYPNAARASYGWVDFEHHATTWELKVAGVAQACAAMCMDAGEPAAATSMLSKLVQAIPLNSALVEALMRAHIADDDPAGADAVYQEHATALDQAKLGDPDDSIEQLRLDLRTP